MHAESNPSGQGLKELVLALIWWFFSWKKIVPRREDSVRTSKIHLIIMKVLHQAPPKCFHHFRFHHLPSKWCDAEVKAFNFKWPKWFVATFDLCLKLLWPVLSWIPLQKLVYIHTHTKIFKTLFLRGSLCLDFRGWFEVLPLNINVRTISFNNKNFKKSRFEKKCFSNYGGNPLQATG